VGRHSERLSGYNMIEFLIAISFFGSLLFTILLRRMDRSQNKLHQIKRLGELQARSLEDLAEKHTRSIKDAILDFEILIRQGRQAQDEVRSTVGALEEKLEDLKEDRQMIESIAGELTRIAGSARQVQDQVEHLDQGLTRLGFARSEIDELQSDISRLNQTIEGKGREAEAKIAQVIQKLVEEADDRTRLVTDQIRSSVQTLKEEEERLQERMDDQSREAETLAERLASLNNRIEEKWLVESGRMDERLQGVERKMVERFQTMESGLASIRQAGIESVQNEVTRIRDELDNFNLDAIAKRDEILNETRRMAQGMGDQIALFQEKYLSAENRLLKHAEQQKAAIREKMETFEKQWLDMEEKRLSVLDSKLSGVEEQIDEMMTRQTSDLEERISGIQTQIDEVRKTQVSDLTQESSRIREEAAQLRDNLSVIGLELKAGLRSETENALSLLREARKSEEENMGRGREELMRVRQDIQDRLGSIEDQIREIGKSRQKFEDLVGKARRDIHDTEESTLAGLQKKAAKFMAEQDSKLEKLGGQIDDRIAKQITQLVNKGQLHIDELEKRTAATIREYMNRMEENVNEAKLNFRNMTSSVDEQMSEMRALREQVLREIQGGRGDLEEVREKLRAVHAAEEMILKLDETLEVMTERVSMAKDENSHMDEFMRNFEQLKLNRKEIESELKSIESQKKRLLEVEERFESLEKESQDITLKMTMLAEGEKIADRVEERIREMAEFQGTFDKYFSEMNERKNFIEKAVRYMEKARLQVKTAHDAADRMLSKVDRAEMRQEEIEKYLALVESRASMLKKMEEEIQKVESRFEQMDGLMTDLDGRQKQVGLMARKIEEVKTSGEEIKVEMESLLQEADEKMERLSAFYQTIDRILDSAPDTSEDMLEVAALPAARKGRKSLAAGLPEWKKDGILSLYMNHKWDADLIAERMKIDPSIVKAVIASHG